MNRLPRPLEPTAEIPLLEGLRLKLVTSLTRGDSYYGLSLLFPDMISHASSLPQWMTGGKQLTRQCLDDIRGRNSRTWLILHSIPRDLLISACLGTVAFDGHRTQNNFKTYKDDKGLGIYILAMSVAGRHGAWVTARELHNLISNLKKYIRAYRSHRQHGGVPPDAASKELQRFIHEVDNTYGTHDKALGPRFIDKDSVVPSMEALVASLQKRKHESLRHDPSGNTPLIQAPQYVGCSNTLSKRADAYKLRETKSALKRANKAFALIMCLMAWQGLEPVSVTVPAIKLFDNTHLPDAEILLASMTNCYITQDGLNRTEAGGQLGLTLPFALNEAEEYVMARETFLHDNLSLTCADLNERNAFIREFANFKPLTEGQVHDNLTDLDQWLSNMQQETDAVLRLRGHFFEEMDVMREKIKIRRANIQALKDVHSVFEALR